jgi:hypothetical protein
MGANGCEAPRRQCERDPDAQCLTVAFRQMSLDGLNDGLRPMKIAATKGALRLLLR